MPVEKRNIVRVGELFELADTEFGIEPNQIPNVFYSTGFLTHDSYNDIDSGTINSWLDTYGEDENEHLVARIMLKFMKQNRIRDMIILN